MTKVIKPISTLNDVVDSVSKTEQCESSLVGLSYSPYLTVFESQSFDIEQKEYKWGEKVTRVLLSSNSKEITTNKPPVNHGERITSKLTSKGKSRIRRAARLFQYLAETEKGYKGYASMITLTFGKWYPDDKLGKKLLDTFFKRLKRKLNVDDFYYVWVAERQKRGAIHFHILTPHYTPKNWLNAAWNDIVNKHLDKKGLGQHKQKLYPNVTKVYNAGAYMVKYCQKEGENIKGNGYNMSQQTSNMITPRVTSVMGVNYQEVLNVYDDLKHDNQLVYENDIVSIFWTDK